MVIGLTFGIWASLPLPQRVNLSLDLGTIAWFFIAFILNFSFLPHLEVAKITLHSKLLFPPPGWIGLKVMGEGVRGWRSSISKC